MRIRHIVTALLTVGLALGSAREAHPQLPLCFHPLPLGANGGDPALVRSAHLGWIRITLRWAEISPEPGAFDFARYDPLVDRARAEGLEVLAILSTAPEWAGSNPNGTRPAPDVGLWRELVRRTAEHFAGRVAAYEVWNEPNLRDEGLGIGWAAPLAGPPGYGEYLRAAAEAIRAEAPGTLVVGPASSSLPDERTVELFELLERPFADGLRPADFLDVVSVHANALDREEVPIVAGRVGSQLETLFRRNPANLGKPVWVTELGWPSEAVGEVAQRERTAALLEGWSRDCRPQEPALAFLYQEKDVPGERGRGLFRSDGTPKPIVRTYLGNLAFPARTRDPLSLGWSAICRDLECELEATEWLVNPFARPVCRWSLGDGTTAEGCRILHRYTQAGTRTVRLRVELDGFLLLDRDGSLEPSSTCLDLEPPALAIREPLAGADLTGSVRIFINTSDNLGFSLLEALIDGRLIQQRSSQPLAATWETGAFPTGPHELLVRVTDRCGNVTAATRPYFVDRRPPEVSVGPRSGEPVSGRTVIEVDATDNRAVARVELVLDRRLAVVDPEAPFDLPWNTQKEHDGPHTVAVAAWDRAGNRTAAPPLVLRVDNQPPELAVAHPAWGQPVAGLVRLAGWATDATGTTLSFALDDAAAPLVGEVERLPRPSVCALFASLADPACPAVGWRAFLDTTRLAPGPHELAITATDGLARRTTVLVRLVVSPPPPG